VANKNESLKNILEDLFKAYGWTEKMDGVRIVNSWEKVVGSIIANHTTKLYVNRGVLFVSVDSAALSHELFMERSELVDKLNKEIGKKVITEIVIK